MPISPTKVLLFFVLWTLGCVLGAFHLPMSASSMILAFWMLKTKDQVKAELNREIGKLELAMMVVLLGVVLTISGLAKHLLTPVQVAAIESFRGLIFASTWLGGTVLMMWEAMERSGPPAQSDGR